jgi:hypothetical protein
MQKLSIFLTFLFIVACGCGNDTPQCAHGNPTAIFHPEMKFIKNHTFQQKESNSSEQLEIPEFDLSLEILQSGCERIKQMFKITLNGSQNDLTTAPQIAELTADIFAAISQLDKEKLGNFFQVAQWTGQNAAQFSLDSPVLISNPDNSQIQLSLNLMRQPKQTIISLTIEF